MSPEVTNTEVPEQKIIKSSPSHLIILFLVILGVALLSALGTYYYLLPQLQNQKNNSYPLQQSDQSNTNAVNQNISGIEGWRTYTSNILGSTMKYPQDVNFEHQQLISNTSKMEYLRFENANGYMTLETLGCHTGYPNPVLEDTITIAGIKVKRYRVAPSGDYNQLVANPKLTENLCLNLTLGLKPNGEKQTKALFDQILSTVTVSGQQQATDTTSWKTYTNSVYGFTVKYPSDWEEKSMTFAPIAKETRIAGADPYINLNFLSGNLEDIKMQKEKEDKVTYTKTQIAERDAYIYSVRQGYEGGGKDILIDAKNGKTLLINTYNVSTILDSFLASFQFAN